MAEELRTGTPQSLFFHWHDALMLKYTLRRVSAHASTGLILEILERCT
jgi:hypothetical protein